MVETQEKIVDPEIIVGEEDSFRERIKILDVIIRNFVYFWNDPSLRRAAAKYDQSIVGPKIVEINDLMINFRRDWKKLVQNYQLSFEYGKSDTIWITPKDYQQYLHPEFNPNKGDFLNDKDRVYNQIDLLKILKLMLSILQKLVETLKQFENDLREDDEGQYSVTLHSLNLYVKSTFIPFWQDFNQEYNYLLKKQA